MTRDDALRPTAFVRIFVAQGSLHGLTIPPPASEVSALRIALTACAVVALGASSFFVERSIISR